MWLWHDNKSSLHGDHLKVLFSSFLASKQITVMAVGCSFTHAIVHCCHWLNYSSAHIKTDTSVIVNIQFRLSICVDQCSLHTDVAVHGYRFFMTSLCKTTVTYGNTTISEKRQHLLTLSFTCTLRLSSLKHGNHRARAEGRKKKKLWKHRLRNVCRVHVLLVSFYIQW